MSDGLQAVVIAHIEAGEMFPTFHVVGDDRIRLFIVDENTPGDRVYEWLRRSDPAIVRQLIPEGSSIGSSQDDRHAAIENRILSALDARPHLSVVAPSEKPNE